VSKVGRKGRLAPAAVRAPIIFERLRRAYPEAKTALDHTNPYQLIVATILSAQTTDVRVNLVTPELFRRYPDALALARAKPSEVEKLIQSTGFFRSKTRSIIGMAQGLVADHGGEVPRTMEALVALPGVGRKTANVVLGNAFGENQGVVVDTHVTRLSQRLGLTRQTEPAKIEPVLMRLFPRESWALLSHLLIFHGRQICVARKPKCPECVLNDICPSAKL
jgi:endonuclease III